MFAVLALRSERTGSSRKDTGGQTLDGSGLATRIIEKCRFDSGQGEGGVQELVLGERSVICAQMSIARNVVEQ